MDTTELRESRIRLENFMERLWPFFGRKDRWQWADLYLTGLLLNGDRKSAGAMAGRLDVDEQGLQQFVGQSTWDWREVRREAAILTTRRFSNPSRSALIIDDTGFAKKGTLSPCVARQYTGTLGKIGNCQVATSLSYATDEAAVPVDFELYMPEEWADDIKRRRAAKIPDDIAFKRKWELALDLLDRAGRSGLTAYVLTADAGYGVSTEFREALRQRNQRYCVAVTSDTGIWSEPPTVKPPEARHRGRPPKRRYDLPKPVSAKAFATGLGKGAGHVIEWREGTKKKLKSRFAACRVQPSHGHASGLMTEPVQWLLIEWPIDEREPMKFWLSDLPEDTSLSDLVYFAKIRWWIEQNYQQLKEELGMDHFEGRSWAGWHRHVTMTMLAFYFLAIERLRQKKTSGWTLPQCRAEIQRMLVVRIGCCPTCLRPARRLQPVPT